ncbi:hypothetical protein INR49_008836 [Caranx melampygus]|nr:hypothetical protein INR49_008836 [Caranx melampygus]
MNCEAFTDPFVVMVGAELQRSVSQQVGPLLMVPTVSRKGRLPRLAAAAHMFEDAQPKAGEVVEPLVTADERLLLYKVT